MESPVNKNIIHIDKISVYRKKILVLSQLSLEIEGGEFVYLLGKTGSGKTSLLKTLYAELPVEEGYARIADFELTKITTKQIPFLRRILGIVFQDFQLLTDRSVNENLEFIMRATGWRNTERMEERSLEVLTMVGIPTKGFKMPHELSGGEQQRVCIARSLLNNPPILLADEPTGNLDPDTSRDILKLLHLINQSGTTVLLATHNHYLIDEFPGRMVFLDRGRVVKGAERE
ncbi:MAG: ATP-binding cassette domain-containing protein [Bacteroidales bacterium]|nr:ATP-binding cassette domain-containing protein [Bacteroidales bacterium]